MVVVAINSDRDHTIIHLSPWPTDDKSGHGLMLMVTVVVFIQLGYRMMIIIITTTTATTAIVFVIMMTGGKSSKMIMMVMATIIE